MVKNLPRKLFGLFAATALALYAIAAFDINWGLDLKGGARIVYRFDFQAALEDGQIGQQEFQQRQQLLQQMADIFLKRLDASGLADIPIYPQGEDQIVIELPDRSEAEVAQIKDVITNQGLLNFRIVADDTDDVGLDTERAKFQAWLAEHPDGNGLDFDRVPEEEGGPRPEVHWFPVGEKEAASLSSYSVQGHVPLLMQDALRPERAGSTASWEFTGADLSYVGPSVDGRGFPAVAFEFRESRKTAFGDFTDEYRGRLMAILLNNEVQTAPVIKSRLPGGGIIEGGASGFSQDEVRNLVTVLRTGSLRVLPELESESYVGPSLGADSIRTGVRSALFGGILVILFMLFYYRVNGIVATLSLGFNGFLLIGALYFTQATLTLPGIAGLVLTIGMAVDANILVFERVREEIRKGRDVAQAYKNGFENAFSTIVDANVTTLITALILYVVGTGPVKGFAAVLGLGILTTLFSVLVFSKVVFHYLVFRLGVIRNVKMMAILAKETHVRFLNKRKYALVFSLATITSGLFLFSSEAEDMLGIDFAGGTTARVVLTEPHSITEMRGRLPGYEVVGVAGGTEADLPSGTYLQYQIKKKLTPEQRAAEKERTSVDAERNPTDEMIADLERRLGDWLPRDASGAVALDQAFPEKNSVGARVSGEIQKRAVRAILLSLILTIVYITFRFHEYRYGFAAVIAVVHDVLFTLGVLALAHKLGIVQVEVDLEIIAAFLTIIGYSLNDTIVIFDRIRENLPRMRNRSFEEVIDASINQSLSRTILTSLTTFFVVLVLFIANRPYHNVLEGFSFAMLVGIVIGTYSTMFVATPLLVFFDRWSRKHHVGDEVAAKAERRARKAKGAQAAS